MSERVLVDVADKTEMFAGKFYATILPPVNWAVSQTKNASIGQTHENISVL